MSIASVQFHKFSTFFIFLCIYKVYFVLNRQQKPAINLYFQTSITNYSTSFLILRNILSLIAIYFLIFSTRLNKTNPEAKKLIKIILKHNTINKFIWNANKILKSPLIFYHDETEGIDCILRGGKQINR